MQLRDLSFPGVDQGSERGGFDQGVFSNVSSYGSHVSRNAGISQHFKKGASKFSSCGYRGLHGFECEHNTPLS